MHPNPAPTNGAATDRPRPNARACDLATTLAAMALTVAAGMTVGATGAHAVPTAVESGWLTTRAVPLAGARAAHLDPADGSLYVGRRKSAKDGVLRIHASGAVDHVADADRVAAVGVAPDGGVVWTEDYAGLVGHLDCTAGGPPEASTWVAPTAFYGPGADADPVGVAFAPPGYSGPFVLPGDGVVVEWGSGGDAAVWRVPTATPTSGPATPTLLTSDALPDREYVDVVVTHEAIWVVDTGRDLPGRLLRLDGLGGPTVVPTDVPLAEPVAVTDDPVTGDLWVVDAEAEGGATLYRVTPPAPGGDGTAAVAPVLTGLTLGPQPWAGVDRDPLGADLIVTTAGGVHVVTRCDAALTGAADCDANGVADGCDLATGAHSDCDQDGVPDACAIADGTAEDCDGDGLPDHCPACPPLELVFVLDTSPSMHDEAQALCEGLASVAAQLAKAGVSVDATILGLAALGEGEAFSCLEGSVAALYGVDVPDAPSPELATLTACPGGLASAEENWAAGAAIVAASHLWTPGALRVVVPVSDEGPWCGAPLGPEDTTMVGHLSAVAAAHDVVVSPILGSGSESNGGLQTLAASLAGSTGGLTATSQDPSADLAAAVAALVAGACEGQGTDCNDNGVPDSCDVANGDSADCDGDGAPDECLPPWVGVPDCPGVEVCCQATQGDGALSHTPMDGAACKAAGGTGIADVGACDPVCCGAGDGFAWTVGALCEFPADAAACETVCCGDAAGFVWAMAGLCESPADAAACEPVCCLSDDGGAEIRKAGACEGVAVDDPKLCQPTCCHVPFGPGVWDDRWDLVPLGHCEAPSTPVAEDKCGAVCCQLPSRGGATAVIEGGACWERGGSEVPFDWCGPGGPPSTDRAGTGMRRGTEAPDPEPPTGDASEPAAGGEPASYPPAGSAGSGPGARSGAPADHAEGGLADDTTPFVIPHLDAGDGCRGGGGRGGPIQLGVVLGLAALAWDRRRRNAQHEADHGPATRRLGPGDPRRDPRQARRRLRRPAPYAAARVVRKNEPPATRPLNVLQPTQPL